MSYKKDIAMLEMEKETGNNSIHFIVTLIFLPWILVWLVIGMGISSRNKIIDNKIRVIKTMAVKEYEAKHKK